MGVGGCCLHESVVVQEDSKTCSAFESHNMLFHKTVTKEARIKSSGVLYSQLGWMCSVVADAPVHCKIKCSQFCRGKSAAFSLPRMVNLK
ncbi:hypothetical protein RLOC_00008699 [Lonchura striata]|uniref:Uncharacterized protein n=1 Tax=Lonchura striata TaxID=40157 RepID=A0A218VED1_9PASE|nr:hypothetical protein RLOC_00008699 [Lonchura striata domestica]